MIIDVYYMFIPTQALIDSARDMEMDWLLEPDLCTDVENDRTGRAHSQDEVEHAFWTLFLAKLVSEPPEPELAHRFRRRCLELGFTGCWSVHVARGGGSVGELLREANEAASLAKRAQAT